VHLSKLWSKNMVVIHILTLCVDCLVLVDVSVIGPQVHFRIFERRKRWLVWVVFVVRVCCDVLSHASFLCSLFLSFSLYLKLSISQRHNILNLLINVNITMIFDTWYNCFMPKPNQLTFSWLTVVHTSIISHISWCLFCCLYWTRFRKFLHWKVF